MIKKILGNTSKAIFPLGLGTGFNLNEYEKSKKLTQVIKSAVDMGINLIDTSESYGNGLSEEMISQAIKGKRSNVFLCTKFSPENSNKTAVVKSCENSLKRLHTDYIDIYQFHWRNPKIPLGETFEALVKLKKQGKIRYIGVSNFSKKELLQTLGFFGKDLVVSLQTEFNLHEQFLIQSKMLDFCEKNKISIIAYSPLDQGRLKNLNSSHKKYTDKLLKKYNCSIYQLALNWLISFDQVIPIPKTTKVEHLEKNIETLKFSLDDRERTDLSKLFQSKIHLIPINQIEVSLSGERGRGGYQTLKEALDNEMNLTPGPKELSQGLEDDEDFKPIRLVKNPTNQKYSLINGRVRFWAWVIKFGKNKPIPSYIREDLLL